MLMQGLVLIAPPSANQAQLAAGYEKRFGKSLKEVSDEAQLRLSNGSRQALEKTGFLHCPAASVNPASLLSYYRDANLETLAILAQTELPVLLISGSEDSTSPGFAQAADKLEKTGLSTLDIEGADHFFRDLYADEIIDGVIELLESNP